MIWGAQVESIEDREDEGGVSGLLSDCFHAGAIDEIRGCFKNVEAWETRKLEGRVGIRAGLGAASDDGWEPRHLRMVRDGRILVCASIFG
jgi:hypothetical protein